MTIESPHTITVRFDRAGAGLCQVCPSPGLTVQTWVCVHEHVLTERYCDSHTGRFSPVYCLLCYIADLHLCTMVEMPGA